MPMKDIEVYLPKLFIINALEAKKITFDNLIGFSSAMHKLINKIARLVDY